jgi:REP element-mobilizing transposase RayT
MATVKLAKGLPSLREKDAYDLLRKVFAAACDRFGFRLVHFSIQRDHIHLIVEAADATALTRGMQGLTIRMARALNKLWGRKGTVFPDRYHARPLKTPREVRHALAYVLNNAWKHRGFGAHHPDAYASGWWFDGWLDQFTARNVPDRPTAPARTWLLTFGWRRHGLLSLAEVPARVSA